MKDANFDRQRREFAKLALVGALGGGGLLAPSRQGEAKLANFPPGIKIALQLGADASLEEPAQLDEDLQFAKQLGVEYASIWVLWGL
jgi:hypothetical protein